MRTRVVTYASPLQLEQYPPFQEVQDWVHICATPSLKLGMLKRYRHLGLSQVGFRELIDKLFPHWMSDAVRLNQYAWLTRQIESLKRQNGYSVERLRAFRRNQREVLLAIRVLAEAGLKPGDLQPAGDDERIFVDLWSQMEAADPALEQIRSLLHDTYPTDPERFERDLDRALWRVQETHHGLLRYSKRRLVLHGFYFITPIQYQFVKLCEQVGFELVFLNCYDPRYPAACRTWDAFFRREYDLPGVDEWHLPDQLPPISGIGEAFAALLQGVQPPLSGQASSVTLRRYEDFGAFLMDYRGRENGTRYFSPEASTLNRFLSEFYPPPPGKQNRHFLAYPVGQLLFHLHKMHDEEDGQLKVNQRSLFECFASGWLRTPGGLNGKDYLRALEDLQPFFEGCETLQQWQERARLLRQIRERVVSGFDTPLPAAAPNRRYHQFLHNPLEHVAHFNVDTKTLEAVSMLMDRLFYVAGRLFQSREVTLAEHFDRIEELLLEHVSKADLLEEEHLLLDGLRERLQHNSGSSFLPQDLAEAITLYLGGNLMDPDEEGDDEAGEAEEQERLRPVRTFDRLDGAPLSFGEDDLHLCLLGERTLPRRSSAYPWPLTRQTFAHLPHCKAMHMLALREDQSIHIDRYLLFYTLSWASRLTLSWVVNWQDEVLNASPYLTLIEPYCNGPTGPEALFRPGEPAPWEQVPPVKVQSPEAYETLPPDALAEFALCGRRFFYSFLAQPAPRYRSSFHHEFLYGSLVKAFTQVSGRREEEVAGEVAKLFPQWLSVVHKDRAERAFDADSGYDVYDGQEYARARYPLHLVVTGKVVGSALEVLRTPTGRKKALAELTATLHSREPLLAATSGKHCRYCPHADHCDAAAYAVDDGEEDADDGAEP